MDTFYWPFVGEFIPEKRLVTRSFDIFFETAPE